VVCVVAESHGEAVTHEGARGSRMSLSVTCGLWHEGRTWRLALGESVAYMYPCAPLYLVAESLSM
jgi:hypothetical protein